jgi:hypothetical protein
MHEVQDPVSATKQNNSAADDCRNYQDWHLNLLYLSPYAISVHNIRTGITISLKSISASFVLVRDAGKLDACREVFGDDRADYEQALQAHYADGTPMNWQEGFVTAYATSHPWEDFAETWAHYLHIVDTLEMAGAFGMSVHPDSGQGR